LCSIGILADVLGDREPGGAQLSGEQGGGRCFVMRQFRMGVYALVGVDQSRELAIDKLRQILR
jgi:hypothetical protein